MNVEALQTKYPITDYLTKDKEIELWVELKRLFEPDVDDELWKSQKHVHDITWRLYDTCGVHHAIKSRFRGMEASRNAKNLLETTIRDFYYRIKRRARFSIRRFSEVLPSVWHVVATMIRGQPGLDELEFDDLYNNLKVYEHELKGVSNSNSQNIAFLSTEVTSSTLKQSNVEPAHIPKGYTQATSSKVQTAPNCASHFNEICLCSFFAHNIYAYNSYDEDLLQIE
ncbi:hypothetical protein Tco_0312276 [Tanacetum coccineum]